MFKSTFVLNQTLYCTITISKVIHFFPPCFLFRKQNGNIKMKIRGKSIWKFKKCCLVLVLNIWTCLCTDMFAQFIYFQKSLHLHRIAAYLIEIELLLSLFFTLKSCLSLLELKIVTNSKILVANGSHAFNCFQAYWEIMVHII